MIGRQEGDDHFECEMREKQRGGNGKEFLAGPSVWRGDPAGVWRVRAQGAAIMAGPNEEDLKAQMASLSAEMTAAVNSVTSSQAPATAVAPAGMTRAEFQEWKAAQTERAKARLLELEERLRRLQTLEGQMMRLKTSADQAIDAVPDTWTLPGAVGELDGSWDAQQTRTAAFLNGKNYSQEDGHGPTHRDAQHDAASSGAPETAAGKRPMYGRPISPGAIRKIIREELEAVAHETIEFETNPDEKYSAGESATQSAWDTGKRGSHAHGDANLSSQEDDDAPTMTEAEREARRRQLLNAQSWLDTDQLEQKIDAEITAAKGMDIDREPATLGDAVVVSCPLFFGGFSRRSAIRQQCFEIKKSLWWQSFFLVVVVINSLFLVIAPELKPVPPPGQVITLKEQRSLGEFYFDLACAVILAFEVITGVIAYGFVQSDTTYLRNSSFHKLDFACLIFTLLEYVGELFDMPDVTFRPFRLLRVFKPITKIKSFHGVRSIIVALSEGAPQFGTIFMFMMLTLVAWVILGMSIYSTSFGFRCVQMEGQVPLCASDQSNDFNATCDFTSGINRTTTVPEGALAISAGYPFETYCKVIGFEAKYDEVLEEYLPPDPNEAHYEKKLELFLIYQKSGRLKEPGYHDKTGGTYTDSLFAYPKDVYGRWHTCQRTPFLNLNTSAETMCEAIGNPMGGYSHFDNFWGTCTHAFVRVLFVCITKMPHA